MALPTSLNLTPYKPDLGDLSDPVAVSNAFTDIETTTNVMVDSFTGTRATGSIMYYDGTSWKPTTTITVDDASGSIIGGFSTGLRSALPGSAHVGSMFYATDQFVLYIYTGAAWTRLGAQAGDIIWTKETAARSGYVLLQGQAWPATTGPYADLFALWGGATLPDVAGRTFVALGTNAAVNTVLNNDGQAVANRRPQHRTSDSKTVTSGSLAASNGTLSVNSGSLTPGIGSLAVNAGTLGVPDHVHTAPVNGDGSTSGNFGAFVITDHAPDRGGGATYGMSSGGAIAVQGSPGITGTPGLSGSPALSGAVQLVGTPALTGTIGTGIATDAADAPSYVVLVPQAKL